MNKKILTFSFDDGVTQDRQLISMLDKYGFKATFNINSALLGLSGQLLMDGKTISHNKVSAQEVKLLYANHEVAAHTLHHPDLKSLTNDKVIEQVEQDRLALENLCGRAVIGMAYPGGGINYNQQTVTAVKQTNIKYARSISNTYNFEMPKKYYEWQPSVWALDNNIELLANQFLSLQPQEDKLFYIWGHAYEFDLNDNWARLEKLLKMLSGKSDIDYLTSGEIYLRATRAETLDKTAQK